MADLSINAANVVADADGLRTEEGTCGSTITAGMAVKYNPSTKKWDAVAQATPILATDKVGISLTGGALDQPIVVMLGGTYTAGATVAAGTEYYVGIVAGGLCVSADVTQGEYRTRLGQGISTTKIKLGVSISAVAHA